MKDGYHRQTSDVTTENHAKEMNFRQNQMNGNTIPIVIKTAVRSYRTRAKLRVACVYCCLAGVRACAGYDACLYPL